MPNQEWSQDRGRFVTDDALRAGLDSLRQMIEAGLKDVRRDIHEGHERLRTDVTARLSDAVEAKVRIQILEENGEALDKRIEAEKKEAAESRRFLWAQVVAVAGIVAGVVTWVWK